MSRKGYILVGFFVGLFAIFLLVLNQMGMLEKRSKLLGKVLPFSFVNQDGKRITETELNGKVVLVNFFFTTCTTICPPMNNTMKRFYTKFKDNPNFMMLSLTVDPKVDTVARLKQYADSMQVNTAKWVFATGSKDSIYYAARNSFRVDDQNVTVADVEKDFIHTLKAKCAKWCTIALMKPK
jgi:protein SCO1